MIRREDTERAVEILTRYQSTLRSPEKQELKASVGSVSHIFQSELFQALLDIHEFYDFTLRAAPLQPPSPDSNQGTARQQHGPGSTVPPAEPQHSPEGGEQRLPAGAGGSAPGTPPRLVKVMARRTAAPASVCSLVLGSRSALPQGQEGGDVSGFLAKEQLCSQVCKYLRKGRHEPRMKKAVGKEAKVTVQAT